MDNALLESFQVANRLSSKLKRQSNLTRFSDRAFTIRLSKFFPADAGLLSPDTFSIEYAIGPNPSIAQLFCLVSALEQVAVKNANGSPFDRAEAPSNYSNVPFSSIYSNHVWTTGEARLSDPAILPATIIARNAWLEPVANDSSQVRYLADAYRKILADTSSHASSSARALAHRGLSMGTPLSAVPSSRGQLVGVKSIAPTLVAIFDALLPFNEISEEGAVSAVIRRNKYKFTLKNYRNAWCKQRLE